MSWLRAMIWSGSSCRYSIARMACSVPLMPRQRRPGHKPCLPRMKRRAVSMSIVSMMAHYNRLTTVLIEEYHITAYRSKLSYFLQKYDIVHQNGKKLTKELYI